MMFDRYWLWLLGYASYLGKSLSKFRLKSLDLGYRPIKRKPMLAAIPVRSSRRF